MIARLAIVAALATSALATSAAADPAPAPPATQWMGCLYTRADLARGVSKLYLPDGANLLVLASLQRQGTELHAFVAIMAIDHPPADHESVKLTGRVDDTVRGVPKLPVSHVTVAMINKSPDLKFAGERPGGTYFDYELHGVAVGGDAWDVTLASSQETQVFDGSKHLAIPVKRMKRLAECQFTPNVSATQPPEVEP